MRVLLINPYYPIAETPSPPLGLAYLAAVLSASGVEVEILDLVVCPYSPSGLQALLERFNPQIVGITAVTMTFDSAVEVIKDVKSIRPDILTVMGGPHVSFCAADTLQNHPELDLIVLGEGEETLLELTRAVDQSNGWEGIDGLAYRRGTQICLTAQRALIEDLDTLPVPARHLLPLGRYRALGMPITMTTSRGCPFKCIFCVGRKMVGARVRYRHPEKVVDELEDLSRLNFHQINIADDLFTANSRHCLAICDDIIKRGLQLRWTSFARVDTVSEEILTRMKAAGCNAVSFGIESGNGAILKTIKKGITREQVVTAVQACRNTGVIAHASFILGLPGETPETIQETLEFGRQLQDLGLSYGFHSLAPFPGTEVREESAKLGIHILTDDWTQYHANRAIVETAAANREMLDSIVIGWENDYHRLLADIQARMQTGEATPEEADQVLKLERIAAIYDLMMTSAIERKGTWSDGGHHLTTAENLRILADNISAALTSPPAGLYEGLSSALQQGHLICTRTDGKIQWQWVDFLN
jgi:anaerobic magnesium-protoporphyrin IX monomethyl ester cyclase